MLHYTLLLLQAIACVSIMLSGIFLLAKMEKKGNHRLKLSFVLLVAAGGGGLINCFVKVEVLETFFAVAIALFLQANRRNPNVHHARPTA